MIKSNKLYTPQSYLEAVTNNYYIPNGDDDVSFIDKILEARHMCLWNYPLIETDIVIEERRDVVLVECRCYNEEKGEFEKEYRWYEVPEDFVEGED